MMMMRRGRGEDDDDDDHEKLQSVTFLEQSKKK
jgi:hypothetical protein